MKISYERLRAIKVNLFPLLMIEIALWGMLALAWVFFTLVTR